MLGKGLMLIHNTRYFKHTHLIGKTTLREIWTNFEKYFYKSQGDF